MELEYFEHTLTKEQVEATARIYNILHEFINYDAEHVSINDVININTLALVRLLAQVVPPQATEAIGDAIGHSITLSLDAIHKHCAEMVEKEGWGKEPKTN